jgi:heterogeneous nuclear rnp K-like protein 2
MPEAADSNRKRSRSPSDTEHQKHHKRPNTGVPSDATSSTRARASSVSSARNPGDVAMTETTAIVGDTTASTPSPRQSHADLPALPETEDSKAASTTSPPPAHIHMRCLIVTQDASIIIGRNGSHVNEIRDKSNARVRVSESIPGNPERILNVSGPLDAVSKVGSCSPPSTAGGILLISLSLGVWSHCTTHQR